MGAGDVAAEAELSHFVGDPRKRGLPEHFAKNALVVRAGIAAAVGISMGQLRSLACCKRERFYLSASGACFRAAAADVIKVGVGVCKSQCDDKFLEAIVHIRLTMATGLA